MKAPTRLRASGLIDPIGIATSRPELRWSPIDNASPQRLELHVDAGPDSGTPHVIGSPAGASVLAWPLAPLPARATVRWRVASVADGASRWSSWATIEAPPWDLLGSASFVVHPDWAGGAEAPAAVPEYRALLELESVPERARLAMATPGVLAVSINGVPIEQELLAPGYATLAVETAAVVWDVTTALRAGSNEIVIEVGTGIGYIPAADHRYAKYEELAHPPALAAELSLETIDGRRILGTGSGWATRLGRTTESHWYGGESRRNKSEPWVPAVPADRPQDLRWRAAPPIHVVETLQAVEIGRSDSGQRRYDLGVNGAGRPIVRLGNSATGRRIELWPGETRLDDGAVDQRSTGGPIFDAFTTEATASCFTPRFVYHGARHYDISGSTPESEVELSLEVLRVSNERVGYFDSDDWFLRTLQVNIDRAVQSNMFSVFTDCPHREKLGWIEQLHLCFSALAMHYDVEAHLSDAVRHMQTAQQPDGLVPSIVPEQVVFDFFPWKDDLLAFRDDPNWGRAIIEVPWLLHRHYGSSTALRASFPAALRYLDYLESRSERDLLDHGLGDWIEIDRSTPRGLVATFGWAEALRTAARSATALGDTREAGRLEQRAQTVWSALVQEYCGDDGMWGSGSQASWALGWANPYATQEQRAAALEGLLGSIEAADDAITVGEIGLTWLLRALASSGHSTLLNRLIRRTDTAGYGYQIASGATSLTESWQGPSGTEGVASQNHFMLGAIDEWLVEHVAGLRQAPGSIGWRTIVVSPNPPEGVRSARYVFESPRGPIEVAWRNDDGEAWLAISAPQSSTVIVDAPPGWQIRDLPPRP